MPAMTLKAVKAKFGDALILTTNDATVLIDGGPPGVYKRFLKKHLALLDEGGFEAPVIDLMMVSHIDSDHIAGILDLTRDMEDAMDEDARPPVQIHRAWLNSFADTLVQNGLEAASSAAASPASLASASDEDPVIAKGLDGHTKLVLSSVRQGSALRNNLEKLTIPINPVFANNMAIAGAAGPWEQGNLKITVIGPTQKEVDRLKARWAKDLKKILQKAADKKAAAESMDSSVFNLSSIVCIAEAGGKSILLTGDARGDTMLKWLEERGGPLNFDIFKLPHHGSDRNVTEEMFQKIKARHYLVSGDGKHGNPEPAMFDMLFKARGDEDYTIHMTYSPDELKAHREFIKHDLGKDLDKVLDAEPWRRGKLRFPGDGETSISLDL